MPNTLAHIGVQTVLGRSVVPHADIKWVLLSCVIPDISWILQILLRRFTPDTLLIDLRLYAVVQSSLLFCLVLAGALALLSRAPRRTFTILAVGTVAHLLLDATQIKLGNGVVLFAPIDWTLLSFELYWPEQWPSYALTLFGAATLVYLWWHSGPDGFTLHMPPLPRLAAAVALFMTWSVAPFPFMPQAEAANLHNTALLRSPDTRDGQIFTVDRNNVSFADDGTVQLRSWVGETFTLEGDIPANAQNVSLTGTFIDQDRIAVSQIHIHLPGPREWFSYIGLFAILGWWLQGLWRGYRRS